MTVRLLVGDCRVTLPTLAPGSVQCVVTSPPYYGLRSYIADGDPLKKFEIGLEPTPELYIEHLVECFREVRRVLRDDGTCWVNLGDSYAGSGKGPSNSVQGEASQIGPSAVKKRNPVQFANGQAPTQWISTPRGLKPKDLMMMPFRVAMALQADGWWVRSVIPWLKRNSMPESVTDRPSTSVEYVFLLAKSARYHFDGDAIRVPQMEPWRSNGKPERNNWSVNGQRGSHDTVREYNPAGRNRRNSDWFFESWQGLMLDEQDDPLALVVNPQPFTGSHFATFPPKLVEPMVKASTSEKGQCPECGAPWVRLVSRTAERPASINAKALQTQTGGVETARLNGTAHRSETTGWRPSCAHTAEAVSQVVLDPFAGAGSTLLVADRVGRNAIGCELKATYSTMATDRIVADAPLFAEVAAD